MQCHDCLVINHIIADLASIQFHKYLKNEHFIILLLQQLAST